MKYRRKKIFLDKWHLKYCFVKLFDEKIEMQEYYKKACPFDKGHESVRGVHNAFTLLEVNDNGLTMTSNQTGQVFLCANDCGAGIVSHELMHAVLWAYNHTEKKEPYPIIIKDMEEEETILHNHTYAVIQFYNWYWKVVEKK